MKANDLLSQLQGTLQELRRLFEQVQTGRSIDTLKVSDELDRLTGFRAKYQARLLTRVTVTKEEFAERLGADIKQLMGQTISLIDYVTAHGTVDKSQIDAQEATERYNNRAAVLDRLIEYLNSPRQPFDDRETLDPTQPNRITETLAVKSEREIFQIVSRTVPVDPGLDEECSTLLAILIRWAHQEPAVLAVSGEEDLLIDDWYTEDFRAFAGSQELRDYVAPYLTSFIKKALSPGGVEAFDDAFRNLYFAVVNRVINFYETYELVEDDETTDVSNEMPDTGQTPESNVQSALPESLQTFQPRAEGSQVDTSANTAPLPPLEGIEPVGVKTLLTDEDVRKITHEDLDTLPDNPVDSRPSPTKVHGTGLE